MVTPQPISKGPGRRGGASASSGGGGGRAGSEHPVAADLRAGTWRPSGPPRSLPCRFSWPWRASRRWQGAWPRAVRVSDGWSGGSGRAGAAASALQDGAGLGGGARDPQTRPRPVTQGRRSQPAGRGAEAGRARTPLHPRSPRPKGLLSRARGPRFEALPCRPPDRGSQVVPYLLTRLGGLSPKSVKCLRRRSSRGLDGSGRCSQPTAALTRYCGRTLAGSERQTDLGRAASVDGPKSQGRRGRAF